MNFCRTSVNIIKILQLYNEVAHLLYKANVPILKEFKLQIYFFNQSFLSSKNRNQLILNLVDFYS